MTPNQQEIARAALARVLSACDDNQSALGRRVGKKPGHVYSWLERGYVSNNVVIDIEREFPGLVTRYELRPDIYGGPPVCPECGHGLHDLAASA